MADTAPVLVLAGNIREAISWALAQGIPSGGWRFITRPNQLLGLARGGWRVVEVGTAAMRPDYHEIVTVLATRCITPERGQT